MAPSLIAKRPKGTSKKAASKVFCIDCSRPVEDKIMNLAEFERFMLEHIKVDNKTGARAGGECARPGVPALRVALRRDRLQLQRAPTPAAAQATWATASRCPRTRPSSR